MFDKLTTFTKKVSDLADKPTLNPNELKAHFDAAPDEVREYLNKLIDALTKTTLGDSGAKNIGATSISGLTGTDIQTLLESLANTRAKKAQENPISLVLQNGWVIYNDSQPGKYYKDEMGVVWLYGRFKNGSITSGTILTSLPVGYRPFQDIFRPLGGGGLALITTGGSIQLWGVTSASDLSIDGFNFRAV